MVEQTTGENLEALAQERVFRPLGMTTTSYSWRDGYGTSYAVIYLEKDLGLVVLTGGGQGPTSAVPTFVHAVLGRTDTPFDWMGYETP